MKVGGLFAVDGSVGERCEFIINTRTKGANGGYVRRVQKACV